MAALALGAAAPLFAADFYVAPNGSASGSGSVSSPWNLQTALNQPSAVHAGDTIWLRGGTYTGHFTSNLNGSSSSPIVVRQYAGERATIDGYDGTTSTDPALTVDGSYTWFWGFEVTNSSPNRTTNNGGNTPPPGRGPGFYLGAPGIKLINLIVHDTSQGLDVWEAATDAEVTGNIIYYNGWDDLGTRGSGHGIYTQNLTSTKHFNDNVLFEGFSYGIHAYAEGGHLDNLQFQGNTSFDNGGLSHVSGYAANLLVGGTENTAQNPVLLDNYTYFPSGGKYSNLGYEAGCSNATVTGNYFAGGQSLKLVNCTNVTMTGNIFYGTYSGFTSSQYPSNTYYSSAPTGTQVFLRPNAYEPGRANITVYNWDHDATVNVDVSSLIATGSYYTVYDAQNPFGAPVLSGTYDGNSIALPMTGLTPAAPVAWPAPAPSGPEFNAFIFTSSLGPYEFFDVPQSNPFHDAIHTIAQDGLTGGCGGGDFCPNASVSRAQMAVFLLKAKYGAAYVPPPATGTVFTDVSVQSFAAAWIEELAAEQISSGCGGGGFCPTTSVTRAQMAVFLLKALEGSTYAPSPATGSVFSDVPAGAFAASWIEDLAARGITSGCGGGRFCPANPSTRGQMAVFLVTTFSLP